MNISSTKQYPHPVLTPWTDDFVKGEFTVDINPVVKGENYNLKLNFFLNNQFLKNMIDKKMAKYAIHVECDASRFRNLYWLDDPMGEVVIPASEIEQIVEVCPFILAINKIDDYFSCDFHPDYHETTFKINVGDILAIGESTQFVVEKEIDPLRNVPSIFTIGINSDKNDLPYVIDEYKDRIVIKLTRKNFEKYKLIARFQPSLMSSILIFSALIFIIEQLQKIDDHEMEYGSYRWYKVLLNKINGNPNINLSSDSSTIIAQTLLDDPISRAFKAVYEITEVS